MLNELPPVPQTDGRALMARFSFGEDHARRRAIVDKELARIDPVEAARLARERTLELAKGRVDVMAAIARHVPVGVLETLLGESNDDDPELTANRAGILLQARDATAGLIGNALVDDAQTVRDTRRVRDGAEIVVDLAGLPFGAGARACPGRELAVAIAGAVLAVLRAGRVVTTDVGYEVWPNLRIPARLEVEFS